MCPAVFVYLVSVQQNLLLTEPTGVPGHGVELLPVVAELLHVLLDVEAMAGSGVAPQTSQAHQFVAQPALVDTTVGHVVTQPLLNLEFRLLRPGRLFSLASLTQYF